MPVFVVPMLIAYPLIVHLGVRFDKPAWAVGYLALLLTLPAAIRLGRRRAPGWSAIVLSLLAILLLAVASSNAGLVLRLQPPLIFGLLCGLFSATLAPGSVPLISRFAILMTRDTPPPVLRYCRRATLAWAVFFLLMMLASLGIGLFASLETWSWFSNGISYALIGVIFLVEFAVRRQVLQPYVDYSFIQFIRNLRRVDFRRVLELRVP